MISDREAWLLNPVSSVGRTEIASSQYEELRELAVRLLEEQKAARFRELSIKNVMRFYDMREEWRKSHELKKDR